MNPEPQPPMTRLAAQWGRAFDAAWSRLAAEDQTEPPLELLAAFAEGRATVAEEAELSACVAASPVALELLGALLAESGSVGRLPTGAAQLRTLPVAPAGGLAPARRSRRDLRHATAWAAAACLALAGWMGVRSARMAGSVAALSQRADQAAVALVIAEKQRLAAELGDQQRPYLLGAPSEELNALAIADLGAQLAGTTRDAQPMTPEQEAAVGAGRQRVAEAARAISEGSTAAQLERAAALIAAARTEEARRLLGELESRAAASTVLRAQWHNLQGGLAAHVAAGLPAARADSAWQDAQTHFRAAAAGGLNEAWLNLALMQAERGNRAAAIEAARNYLQRLSSANHREALRQVLEPGAAQR